MGVRGLLERKYGGLSSEILPRTQETRCLLLRTFLMKTFTVPFPPPAGILKISVTPLLELLFLSENSKWPRQGRPWCGFISFSQPFLLGTIDVSRIWLACSISLRTSGYLQASAGTGLPLSPQFYNWVGPPNPWVLIYLKHMQYRNNVMYLIKTLKTVSKHFHSFSLHRSESSCAPTSCSPLC